MPNGDESFISYLWKDTTIVYLVYKPFIQCDMFCPKSLYSDALAVRIDTTMLLQIFTLSQEKLIALTSLQI
jgi:hypothetical protein